SRNYGRSHHPRQHEAFDCHAFKRNRQEECVQMPVKIARSTPRPSFGLRELLVASHISRLASRDAAKSLLSTLVSESSGECRFNARLRILEIAWFGFTGPISAKRSARDWTCGWNQGHIGINPRFTLAS